MSAVTVNGLNISDNVSYITTDIQYRDTPNRTINTANLSRRPGAKILSSEFDPKDITINGYIFGTTASGLRGLIDNLQQNAAVRSLALNIDSDRTYTATLKSLQIPVQHYNNTYAPFSAVFTAADPFSYGSQLTVSGTTVSGTVTYSGTITISGTVFSEPTLTVNPTGANAGNSGMSGLQVTYVPTGESLSISGTINYSSDLSFNYSNFTVTNSGVNSDFNGIFSRWEPGVTQFTITVSSGVKQGFDWKISYQPRYYT